MLENGKPDDATLVFQEAVEIRLKTSAKNEASTIRWLFHFFAELLQSRGMSTEAQSTCNTIVAFVRQVFTEDVNIVAVLFPWLSHLSDSNPAQAEPMADECLAICQRKNPPSWRIFDSQCLVGACLLAESSDAESLLVGGYNGMRLYTNQVPANVRIRSMSEALQRLEQLYFLTGDWEQAAECDSERISLCQKMPDDANNLSWFLSTSPEAGLRDGSNAVFYAKMAVARTNRKNVSFLDTLAAAYAETGQFAKAVSIQKEAIALEPDEQSKGWLTPPT